MNHESDDIQLDKLYDEMLSYHSKQKRQHGDKRIRDRHKLMSLYYRLYYGHSPRVSRTIGVKRFLDDEKKAGVFETGAYVKEYKCAYKKELKKECNRVVRRYKWDDLPTRKGNQYRKICEYYWDLV